MPQKSTPINVFEGMVPTWTWCLDRRKVRLTHYWHFWRWILTLSDHLDPTNTSCPSQLTMGDGKGGSGTLILDWKRIHRHKEVWSLCRQRWRMSSPIQHEPHLARTIKVKGKPLTESFSVHRGETGYPLLLFRQLPQRPFQWNWGFSPYGRPSLREKSETWDRTDHTTDPDVGRTLVSSPSTISLLPSRLPTLGDWIGWDLDRMSPEERYTLLFTRITTLQKRPKVLFFEGLSVFIKLPFLFHMPLFFRT